MNWRLTALACFAGSALSQAAAAQQIPNGLVEGPTSGMLFMSICVATGANEARADVAARAQGFVRTSDGASGQKRYLYTAGLTNFTVMTTIEDDASTSDPAEICAVFQEPGSVTTLAEVAALVGGKPVQIDSLAEGNLSVFFLVEEAGRLIVLKLGEAERAAAADSAGNLYELTVRQTAALTTIMYIHYRP
jgi:hypothetical protein